jgi:flagellar hook-associated protein 2
MESMAGITGVSGVSGTSGMESFYAPLFNNSSVSAGGTNNIYNVISAQNGGRNAYGRNAPALSSSDARSYLSSLKQIGGELLRAARNLSSSGDSVFKKVQGASSKDDTLSVNVKKQDDARAWQAENATKNVTIQQLAVSQQNTGNSQTATAPSGAKAGSNQFTIEKGDKTYNLSVNINSTDSARTAQQKMADAINKQNTGITATVQYDDKTKKSALVLTADDSGEKNSFKVTDKEGSNLAEVTGVNKTTREAKDSNYTVDGEQKTDASNTVDLGDGLTGTPKKVTDEAVNASVKKDTTGITNAVYDIVNSFNALREAAVKNNDDKGAKNLQQKMDSTASSYGSSLSHIGITKNKDGYLEVDTKKLQKAFEDGTAERNLGTDSAGFTQRLNQLAKSVDSDPTRYISQQSRKNMDNPASDDANSLYYQYMRSGQNAYGSGLGLLFSSGF